MVAAGLAVILVAFLQARPQLWDPRLTWSAVALAGALLVGAAILAVLDRWRKRFREDRTSSQEQLTSFRELYEKGELSQEEYECIRSRLTARVRQEFNAAPRPVVEPPPPAAPPPEEKND